MASRGDTVSWLSYFGPSLRRATSVLMWGRTWVTACARGRPSVRGSLPWSRSQSVCAFWNGGTVTVVGAAVGALPGTQELKVSQATPTVTSMSSRWIDTVQQVDSFAGVSWDQTIPVHVTTLDRLICEHGLPAFCKIDVEGYEFEVLLGLSQPLPALSIEFVPATLDVTHACLQRLAALGEYEYNWTLGERHEWCSSWGDAAQVTSFLNTLPSTGPSGDIYARLVPSGGHSVDAAI